MLMFMLMNTMTPLTVCYGLVSDDDDVYCVVDSIGVCVVWCVVVVWCL